MNPGHLHFALRKYLGKELTPEAAAHICAIVEWNMMPMPIVSAHGVTADQHPRFFEFINRSLVAAYTPENSRVISRVNGDEILAVALVTEWRRHSVELAVASDGSRSWMTRGFLREVFGYCFNQLGKKRITARIEADNAPAIAMDEALGFVHEGVQRGQFGDNDAILMGMLAAECRWLEKGRP